MSTEQEAKPQPVLRRASKMSSGAPKPLVTPWQSLFYDVANVLMRIAFRLVLSVEVTGLEHLPRQGKLIIIGNHTSWMDPVLIGAFIPRRIVFMSKKENLSNAFTNFIVRSYGVFPVDRGNVDRSALLRMDDVLDAGGALGMFPEGTRNKAGTLQRAKAGTALVAVRHQAPIVPVSIAGAYKGLLGPYKRGHRPHVTIVVGPAFSLPDVEGDAVNKETLIMLTDELMKPLAAGLPPEQRGYYGTETRSARAAK
jgi:1-acyl-sn-glycerol-3-phosphate acyltransferase